MAHIYIYATDKKRKVLIGSILTHIIPLPLGCTLRLSHKKCNGNLSINSAKKDLRNLFVSGKRQLSAEGKNASANGAKLC